MQDVESISKKLLDHLRAELASPALEFSRKLTPLAGGYETATYAFALSGAPGVLSGPLVLRLYPSFYGPRNAIWESTVQNVLAAEGYPVARVHLLCTDLSVLGGAFFLMDRLPGRTLMTAPLDDVPRLLGEAHGKLHDIDPRYLIGRLKEKEVPESDYRIANRFDLRRKTEGFPWLGAIVSWLLANRPPEPQRPAICHGDFHPLNILYADGKITGVLDWPGFAVADPVFDVANTLVLIRIAAARVAESMEGFPAVDWHRVADLYLEAYTAGRSLDRTNLACYQVRRCVAALIEGFEGQKIWQHPLIVKDLLALIHEMTGIAVEVPPFPA
jgi:aminoglycoside phosphotransferase (APT) family kinase protein